MEPMGFKVMRNKTFSDKASYGIQRVFKERFIGGRKKVIKFRFTVKGICNDGRITFIEC